VISLPLLVVGGLAGLAAGSYVTTAALRATRGEQSVLGRSHCDGCGTPLGFFQTAPVISFVSAGGACRHCGGRIDPLHPVGELAGGVIGLAAAFSPPSLNSLLILGLGFTLLASAVVDARTRRLPDRLTMVAALFCLALSVREGAAAMLAGGIAAVAALVLLMAMRALRRRQGRDPGLGLGDVKLICALALWLGARTPWMVVGATVLGLLGWLALRPADGRISFGPMIAVSGLGVGLAMENGLWPASI
jgi:leader peptidase (prepilin peptidase) / N-methyltransferase